MLSGLNPRVLILFIWETVQLLVFKKLQTAARLRITLYSLRSGEAAERSNLTSKDCGCAGAEGGEDSIHRQGQEG